MQSENIRAIALEILLSIDRGEHSHQVLDQALTKYAYLSKVDRAFLSRLVHGTLDYQIQLDYIITHYSSVQKNKMKPVILNILRMAIYQIFYMDRIPDRAACDEAVKLTMKRGLRGLKGFVNGILRNIIREKETIVFPDLSTKYSMPDWIIELWKRQYDFDTIETMLKSYLVPREVSIRVNTSNISVEEVIKKLQKENIKVRISPLNQTVLEISGFDRLSEIECIDHGECSVQDASSSLVVSLSGIKENNIVIDVCAAPGGKTIHAADQLHGLGEVIACDLSEKKVDILSDNVARSGFQNIQVMQKDALEFYAPWKEKADVVLADLPCSGLGIIGKKADIKMNTSLENCKNLAEIQKKILNNVCQYVKPGGRLVFSTCTIDVYENEDNVAWFLEKHKEFSPVDLSNAPVKIDTQTKGYMQLLPGIHPCDGFFISVFEKSLSKG